MLAAQPAVNAVAVVAATVINRANNLIDVLKPKNPPRFLVTARTFMREMPALIAVAPATTDIFAHFFTFLQLSFLKVFYILTTFTLTILYIVTNKRAFVNIPAKFLLRFFENYVIMKKIHFHYGGK